MAGETAAAALTEAGDGSKQREAGRMQRLSFVDVWLPVALTNHGFLTERALHHHCHPKSLFFALSELRGSLGCKMGTRCVP